MLRNQINFVVFYDIVCVFFFYNIFNYLLFNAIISLYNK